MRPYIVTPSSKVDTPYNFLVPLLVLNTEGKRAGNPYRYFKSAEAAIERSKKIPNLGVFGKADNKVNINGLDCFVWFQIM